MRRLINQRPARPTAVLLSLLPFVLAILAYAMASEARLEANPNDKLLPGLGAMMAAIDRMAFTPDIRSGDYLLWADTQSSLIRLGTGVLIATVIGGVIGVLQGLIPYVRTTMTTFVGVIAMIPPLAILPILFIVFGLGETSKIVLIVIGILPFIVRDVAFRTEELPREQIIKAETLGAGTWQILLRVVVPQMLPRLLGGVRLSLGAAWLFLIAAEAIASQTGLGYRIFLMRRYLAMDVIIPYVAWITLLAFLTDYLLGLLQRRGFPWLYRS